MKTIIWDYNGTILDDTWLCLEIENHMCKQRNMKHDWTIEEYRELFCFPVKDYYYKIGYTFENETYEDISVIFNQMYDEKFEECLLMNGVVDKLIEAKDKGYQNIILSACRQDKLIEQTDALGISQYFTQRMGSDNLLASGKVETAKQWMKSQNLSPDDCIYIGDTLHDKETADAIGVKNCYLVASGHQSYEVLKKECDNTVHSIHEVIL